eukprot:TRINITY_DN590_c1_g1_i1.p1 TRINITY_DN590_c1_g1~~TRINITY_DN590_c1_g1_i1.p1  ORF type:complete len:218 (+),score=59.88 TRINITY_DN590_c1_g1_i1:151-804(+)
MNPANTKVYPFREPAKLCSTTQIDPPDDDTLVTITAANAIGAFMQNGDAVAANHVGEQKAPSENDYSVGVLVHYGSFVYSTSGDLSGEFYNEYNDVEQYTYQRIGEVDVMKVNHHGSQHSSSEGWVNTLKPTVSMISCGATNTYGHPTQIVLDRLQAHGSDVFVTERGNPSANYGNAIVANSDIVVTADGGSDYTVTAGGADFKYKTKGVTPPSCSV